MIRVFYTELNSKLSVGNWHASAYFAAPHIHNINILLTEIDLYLHTTLMNTSKLAHHLSEVPTQEIDQILIDVVSTEATTELTTDFAKKILSISTSFPTEQVVQATEESLDQMHRIGLVSNEARHKLAEALARCK